MEKIKGRLGCAVGMVKPRVGSVLTGLVNNEPMIVTVTQIISDHETGVIVAGPDGRDEVIKNSHLGALVFHPLEGHEVMVLSRKLCFKAIDCLKEISVATIENGEVVDIETYKDSGEATKKRSEIPEGTTLLAQLVADTLDDAEECAMMHARSLMEKVNVCTSFSTMRTVLKLPQEDTFDRSFQLYKNATDEEKEEFSADSEVMKRMLGVNDKKKGLGLSLGDLLGGGGTGNLMDELKELLRKLKGGEDKEQPGSGE